MMRIHGKLVVWMMIAAQLSPTLVLAAPVAVDKNASRALVIKIARKIARSKLFKGPEGLARLERALEKTVDAQAARIEGALAGQSDEELRDNAERALEHAKRTGATALEAHLTELLAKPSELRFRLAAQLDPKLRQEFLNRVRARLDRAGSAEAALEEFLGGGGDDDDCWNYKLSYTEVALDLISLIRDGLEGAPPKTLLWAIPLLIALVAIGVPVAFLADTLVFFPIWFFCDYQRCEHGQG
jgi:hypothetical protein